MKALTSLAVTLAGLAALAGVVLLIWHFPFVLPATLALLLFWGAVHSAMYE